MKYFVLKPRSKNYDDPYALASREAMRTYAFCIESENPELAEELHKWRIKESDLEFERMSKGE